MKPIITTIITQQSSRFIRHIANMLPSKETNRNMQHDWCYACSVFVFFNTNISPVRVLW